MSSIVKQKVGNNTYLYESVSFRNHDGLPRNKRTLIGKIEASSGQPIVITPSAPSFTVHDIHQSSIRDFGAFYLYQKLAEQIGLLSVLQQALPAFWEQVFNLAAYLISTGDPYSYCQDWLGAT